jgi:sulfatase maturation enzyme AslB (radical SAM superfamily)
LYENTKDAKLLEIVGGEPFLKNFDEHKEYLKLFVESGQAKDTHIHYVTNGTVFPDETFTNLWKEFENVDITLSIDDTGKRFEYNRYPANWEEVYSNIKQFQKLSSEEQNIEISLSFTVSAFTIYYAGDFVNWCKAEGLPQPWFGVVSLRDYYHPSVHNDTIKQKIEDKLMLSDNIDVHKLKDFLYKDKSAMDIFNNGDSLFKGYIDRLDKKRGQLFSETFPELVA